MRRTIVLVLTAALAVLALVIDDHAHLREALDQHVQLRNAAIVGDPLPLRREAEPAHHTVSEIVLSLPQRPQKSKNSGQ